MANISINAQQSPKYPDIFNQITHSFSCLMMKNPNLCEKLSLINNLFTKASANINQCTDATYSSLSPSWKFPTLKTSVLTILLIGAVYSTSRMAIRYLHGELNNQPRSLQHAIDTECLSLWNNKKKIINILGAAVSVYLFAKAIAILAADHSYETTIKSAEAVRLVSVFTEKHMGGLCPDQDNVLSEKAQIAFEEFLDNLLKKIDDTERSLIEDYIYLITTPSQSMKFFIFDNNLLWQKALYWNKFFQDPNFFHRWIGSEGTLLYDALNVKEIENLSTLLEHLGNEETFRITSTVIEKSLEIFYGV